MTRFQPTPMHIGVRTISILMIPVCLLLGATPLSAAQESAPSEDTKSVKILIEPTDLEKSLADPSLRILDTRTSEDFEKAHIPGAVRVSVADWRRLAGTDGGLSDAAGWTKLVGKLGISNDSPTVVYGEKLSDTARIWWLLRYVGVEHVSILNGGWQHWTQNEGPTDTFTPEVTATDFSPRFQSDRLADMAAVKKSLKTNSFKMVDTRSDLEFAEGHVPGSIHLEWDQLVADDGRFKSPDQLRELIGNRGIAATDTTVCY